jgi:hypothetical protein
MLHLQLDTGSFLPACAIAIRWQVWTTLLVYVLLRFAAYSSRWAHSFTRLFPVVAGRATGVAPRIPAIPDLIPRASTATSPQEKPGKFQRGPYPIHSSPTGKSGVITLPEGCL